MRVVVWKLCDDRWAAYTEDAEIKALAERSGLKLMGVYFRKNRDGGPFAWQFTGPKETVLALAELNSRANANVH